MDRKTKTCLIWELNQKINEYVHNRNLFSGGCCYSAYLLADVFTKMGIKYRTVLFQSYDVLTKRQFNNVVNGDGCDHVAIEVTLNGQNVIIGDYNGIMDYYKIFCVKYAIRRYRTVTPKMLLQAYVNNAWNLIYNTENNFSLSDEINNIMKKYISVTR